MDFVSIYKVQSTYSLPSHQAGWYFGYTPMHREQQNTRIQISAWLVYLGQYGMYYAEIG